MDKTQFNVVVNPFTKESIITNPHDKYFALKLMFKELDDWTSFTYQETIYDVHFYYDGEFSFEIYPMAHKSNDEQVNAYNENFSESLTNKLEIKY